MRKKALALILSASMAAMAVTGCSSSKKETEAQTKAQTEAQTEAKTEAKTEAAAPETEAAAAAVEAASEAAAAVEETMTEAVDTVEEAVTEAAAGAETAVEEASEAADTAVEAASETVDTAVEEASEAADTVEEAMTEAAAAVEETMTEAAETVEEAMTEAAAAAEALVEEASEAAETAVEAASETVDTVVEEASEAAETVEEAMTEAAAAAEEAMTEAEEAVEELMTEAAAAVEELAEEASEAADTALEEASEAAETVLEEASEAVEEILPAAVLLDETAEEETNETALEEEPEAAFEEETEAISEEETEAEPEISFDMVVSDNAVTGTFTDMGVTEDDIVVLYMNDIHGGISADKEYSGSSSSLGFAGLAAVKEEAEDLAADVTVVDCGDAIQGSVVTTESDGHDVMDLMDEIGYDIRIPGNHEFDYGMEAFLAYAEEADSAYICSNFIDSTTGEAIFDGYTLVDYTVNDTEITIGYVGMTTPETIAKSTPTYFQDEEGNYIYGFDAETPQDLYDNIQGSIDAAYEAGADVVIGLAHMGDMDVEPDWSSVAVAANTTGMDVILDGHAHSVVPGKIVANKDGEDVLITSTGTKLENIGVLKLSVGADGVVNVQSGLVNALTEEEKALQSYNDVYEMVQDIEDKYAYLFVVEGTADNDLIIYDPLTEDRLIRVAETNLGDFLADAYRLVYNNDIGMINGGSIRANVDEGDINYMDIISVFPWNTDYSVVEVSGQVILDCLEMGAHLYPEECGGFMQVSGLTYKIDSTIPSSVQVNSDGEFVSVDGEYRVKDVMVGDEPLDLEKTYRLGINTYYSKEYGDGMTMFKDSKFIFPAEDAVESAEEESTETADAAEIPTEPVIDHDVVIAYLEMLGGATGEEYADLYGQGRITVITEEDKAALETEAETEDIVAAVEEAISEVAEEAENLAAELTTEAA